MDPTVIVYLAIFGAGFLSGSGATHAIVKGASATKHAIVRVVRHKKAAAAEVTSKEQSSH